MDDGLTTSVQEVETSQDLTTPAANHLWLDGFQSTHVPGEYVRERERERERESVCYVCE